MKFARFFISGCFSMLKSENYGAYLSSFSKASDINCSRSFALRAGAFTSEPRNTAAEWARAYLLCLFTRQLTSSRGDIIYRCPRKRVVRKTRSAGGLPEGSGASAALRASMIKSLLAKCASSSLSSYLINRYLSEGSFAGLWKLQTGWYFFGWKIVLSLSGSRTSLSGMSPDMMRDIMFICAILLDSPGTNW